MNFRVVALLVIGLWLAGCASPKQASTAPRLASATPTLTDPSPTTSPFPEASVTAKPGLINPADGAELKLVPAGEFVMGAEPETALAICEATSVGCTLEDFLDESPPHAVYLNSFWIYATEVTNAQYRICVEAGVCSLPAFLEFYDQALFADHPAVYVSWYQAEAYCDWAGGRLPTEAEWEKSARGEDGRLFPWGDHPDCGYANLKGCTQGLTADVGTFPEGASPYGILDLAGNAAEWVADWYDPAYYAVSPPENPQGPAEGEMKAARGGSWKNPFSGVRATNRSANFPEVFSSGVGFRCVLEALP